MEFLNTDKMVFINTVVWRKNINICRNSPYYYQNLKFLLTLLSEGLYRLPFLIFTTEYVLPRHPMTTSAVPLPAEHQVDVFVHVNNGCFMVNPPVWSPGGKLWDDLNVNNTWTDTLFVSHFHPSPQLLCWSETLAHGITSNRCKPVIRRVEDVKWEVY